MGLGRRDFLKVAAGGALGLAASLSPTPVLAREPKSRLPGALGLLYDATVCIGCRACTFACKEYNHLPPVFLRPTDVWDNPLDLSDKTYNIIKLYQDGMPLAKDQEIAGRIVGVEGRQPGNIDLIAVADAQIERAAGFRHVRLDDLLAHERSLARKLMRAIRSHPAVILIIINSSGTASTISIALIKLIDSVLISVALFIFASSLYQLFIGPLNLPSWMLSENLYQLKAKLGGMVILVMALTFLEHLVVWKDPVGHPVFWNLRRCCLGNAGFI